MSWNKSKSAQESLDILRQLSAKCAELGGRLSQELNSLVQIGDYAALLAYEIDYDAYEPGNHGSSRGDSVNDYIYARQILGLFQKAEFLDLGIDKEAAAADRYIRAERMCLETNTRFQIIAEHPKYRDARVAQVLHLSALKIAEVLGPVPRIEDLEFRFGPGANTNVKGALANPRAKLGAPLECSTNFTRIAGWLLSEAPLWTAHHSSYDNENCWTVDISVVCGKVVFVPKNAKTFRTIGIEPGLNSFFQLGVGSCMKERLMRSGINLYDQSINQRLALEGSISGEIATVDVIMASDCIASLVVQDQFPMDWFDLLDDLRTPNVMLPKSITPELLGKHDMTWHMRRGVPYTTEKFSGMGNGYTFELESVLFYGLCFGVCSLLGLSTEKVSVYGDDLIVPVEAYDLLVEVLGHCGLEVNLEKSFSRGPFRESCGADFLKGFDIRPFYQKTLISERTLFTMHNWFVRHCELELAALVRQLCDPCYILHGPDGFGDGHLIGHFELRRNRRLNRDGWGGGYFDTYVLRERRFTKMLPGDALLPAYSVYTRSGKEGPTDPDVVRGTDGYAKVSIYTLVTSIFRRKT